MLSTVARGLKDLKSEVAFVGGAAVELYIDDPGAPPVRLSDDIDCVVEVVRQVAFHKLQERLVNLGFKHPTTDVEGSICRLLYKGILVDFMPTDEKILGFKNRWYSDGLKHAIPYILPDRQEIQIFTLPYFLATKKVTPLARSGL